MHKSRIRDSRGVYESFRSTFCVYSEIMDRRTDRFRSKDAPTKSREPARLRSACETHADPRTKANLSRLLFLFRVFLDYLSSRRRSAEMSTDVHTHLNDGRETTVATTVIHDHVDLQSVLHTFVCLMYMCMHVCACVRLCYMYARASERANAWSWIVFLMDRLTAR